MTTFDFSGHVVMVTGAGGNLGSATAHAFAQAGAKLILVEREVEKLQGIYPADRALVLSADLTDPASVGELISPAVDHFGQIDILANTVGGYRAGTPVHETPLETWDFMLTLNARTAFLIGQAVIPYMLARGQGKIINVAARGGLDGAAKQSAYSAAKSAVIRLTESMAAELKHSGINVNCVLPGTIDTPQNRAAMPNADYQRWVSPDAIADVIVFLASEAARAITGAAIPVYGRS
jgi:NAD(P)-dependent dehydrogenase (short-subunit alcohol dehydrogenase family)